MPGRTLARKAVMPNDPAPGTCFKAPALRISLSASPVALGDALRWLFQFLLDPAPEPDLHIEATGMSTADVESRMPLWLRDQMPGVLEGATPLLCYGPDHEVATLGRFDGLLSCAVMQAGSGRIRLLCGLGPQGSRTRSIIPSLLVPLLREHLLRRGQLLLHAASVEIGPGVGILLLAPSGGGKTTTALSLVRLGCRLVSDDLVVLDLDSGKPRVWGIPKPLNLRMPTTQHFEELRPHRAPGMDQTERLSLSPCAIYGAACTAAGCRLQAMYFLALQDGEPAAREMELERTMQQLISAHTFSRTQRMECVSVQALLDTTDRIPAYQLSTGNDPGRLGHWLLQHARQNRTESFAAFREAA